MSERERERGGGTEGGHRGRRKCKERQDGNLAGSWGKCWIIVDYSRDGTILCSLSCLKTNLSHDTISVFYATMFVEVYVNVWVYTQRGRGRSWVP